MNIIDTIINWKDRFLKKNQPVQEEQTAEKPFFRDIDEYPDTPGFTGGISPTAWDDMELEESISFASAGKPEKPEPAAVIEYNPLHPESVDTILPPGNEPEKVAGPDAFSDYVQIITPRPKEKKPPLLPNYMNM